MQKRVAIVINKHDATLKFSETFVRVHIERLPCTTVPVMGITNHRIVVGHHRHIFPSRSLVPLGLRWLARQAGLSSIAAQDRKAMRQFLLRWNIDAVMAEYGPNAVSVMEACHDTGVPLIAHFHGFDAYHEYYVEQFGEQYQRLFDLASATIAVSSHMQQQLLRLGARPEKTFVIPCGADVPSGTRADPQAAPPRFVMVGRLTEKKSPLTSIRAFAKMGIRDATLDIVGEGELMDDCRALADSLGIADRVTFYGALPHAETLVAMRSARCFIQHSVRAPNGDHEGTPVSVLEAMALGLPVVATRHGGIMDVITDSSLGQLVDEHDVEAMAARMRDYAVDPALAASVGINARAAVQKHWTADKSLARLWDVIARAIDSRAGNTGSAARTANGSALPAR